MAALADAAGEDEPLVLLLAYTGFLRWGEAAGLRGRPGYAASAGDHLRERRRGRVGNYRRNHQGPQAAQCATTRFLAALPCPPVRGPRARRSLFPGDDGGYSTRPHAGSGWFDKPVTASGVPRTTPHDLRHTAASLAVSAGANVKAVQKMLGHASAAMTLDIYTDLFEDDLEAVATALDKARARESVGKMWARPLRADPLR